MEKLSDIVGRVMLKMGYTEETQFARLAQFAGYDGIVFVNDKVKAFIKDELGYNANVLRVNLHGLIKVGLLSKSGCGQTQYRINPFLFGKGKWEDIYEQQQAFSPGHQDGETG